MLLFTMSKCIIECSMFVFSEHIFFINTFCKNIEKMCSLNPNIDDKFIMIYQNMNFLKYTERVIKYNGIECKEHFIVIYIYFLRLVKLQHSFSKNHINKLFGVLTILFIKMYYDNYKCMSYYAMVLGISLQELLEYEILVLKMLNYDLFVTKNEQEECMSIF